MSDYVQQGVFAEDPFHTLDEDGVGELLRLGAARGRAARDDLTLSICGEHGGSPEAIRFLPGSGLLITFPVRHFGCLWHVLAAAQLVIAERGLRAWARLFSPF